MKGRPLSEDKLKEYKKLIIEAIDGSDTVLTVRQILYDTKVPRNYYYKLLDEDKDFKEKVYNFMNKSNARMVDKAKESLYYLMNVDLRTATIQEKNLVIKAASKLLDNFNEDGTKINNKVLVENNSYQLTEQDVELIKEKYGIGNNRERSEISTLN